MPETHSSQPASLGNNPTSPRLLQELSLQREDALAKHWHHNQTKATYQTIPEPSSVLSRLALTHHLLRTAPSCLTFAATPQLCVCEGTAVKAAAVPGFRQSQKEEQEARRNTSFIWKYFASCKRKTIHGSSSFPSKTLKLFEFSSHF